MLGRMADALLGNPICSSMVNGSSVWRRSRLTGVAATKTNIRARPAGTGMRRVSFAVSSLKKKSRKIQALLTREESEGVHGDDSRWVSTVDEKLCERQWERNQLKSTYGVFFGSGLLATDSPDLCRMRTRMGNWRIPRESPSSYIGDAGVGITWQRRQHLTLPLLYSDSPPTFAGVTSLSLSLSLSIFQSLTGTPCWSIHTCSANKKVWLEWSRDNSTVQSFGISARLMWNSAISLAAVRSVNWIQPSLTWLEINPLWKKHTRIEKHQRKFSNGILAENRDQNTVIRISLRRHLVLIIERPCKLLIRFELACSITTGHHQFTDSYLFMFSTRLRK